MTEETKEQFTVGQEVKVENPTKDSTPTQALPTTKRKSPIKRYNAVPLAEKHGMTTEAGRFKST